MSKFDGLPKLYRKVFVKLDWCHDQIVGGEHHQAEGVHHVKARRALKDDGSWFWKLIDDMHYYSDCDERNIRSYFCDLDSYLNEVEWCDREPRWDDDMTEDELLEIKIGNASKYHHNTPYKVRKAEEERFKSIGAFFF
ncbi:hypothetical protein NVP1127O_15 [Vibrio phage 1.127.O._10N.286.52.E12]|nr:hypothetical protein NVP1127O_15 [Vibrio phage 1.127.O._10N.286.52.E12]